MLNQVKEMGFHWVIYSIGSIAQSAASFILYPFLTKYLSTEEFGIFSLIDLYGFILGSIFYLGITSSLPRSYFDYTEKEDRKSVFTTGFVLLVIGFVLQLLFSYCFAEKASKVFFNTSEYHNHLILISVSSGFNFLIQFFFSFLRLNRKSITITILSFLNLAGSLCLTIYFLDKMELGIWAPIVSRCITFALIFSILLFLLLKEFSSRINIQEAKLLLKFGLGMVFVNLANISIDWSDRFFINLELDLSDVGVYSLAYKLGSIITLVFIAPFEQIWNPMMMEYRNQKGIGSFFSRVLTTYFIVGGFSCLAVCAGVLIISPVIIQSEAFLPALKYFPFISIGLLFYGAVNITNAGLAFERKVTDIAKIFYLVSFINLTLNTLLIPQLELWGAVLSTVLTYMLVPILTHLKSKKHYYIKINALEFLPTTALCFFLIYAVVNFFSFHHYWKSVSASLVILVAIGILAFFNSTSSDERAWVFTRVKNFLKFS